MSIADPSPTTLEATKRSLTKFREWNVCMFNTEMFYVEWIRTWTKHEEMPISNALSSVKTSLLWIMFHWYLLQRGPIADGNPNNANRIINDNFDNNNDECNDKRKRYTYDIFFNSLITCSTIENRRCSLLSDDFDNDRGLRQGCDITYCAVITDS